MGRGGGDKQLSYPYGETKSHFLLLLLTGMFPTCQLVWKQQIKTLSEKMIQYGFF